MGRPVKDYWNWVEITIPYDSKNWKSTCQAKNFLHSNTTSDYQYAVYVTTAYPQPRRRYTTKVVTHYHYYIKDPKLASVFKLKFC